MEINKPPTTSTVNNLLKDIQANILRSHGRTYTWCLFLQFSGDAVRIGNWIKSFTSQVTTALKQEHDYQKRKTIGPAYDGGPVICFFLTASGMKRLGLENEPQDPSFQAGLKATIEHWNTGWPSLENVEENFDDKPIHAMILLADDDGNTLDDLRAKIATRLEKSGAGKVLFTEKGKKLYAAINGKQRVVEHFGYADGISQPDFFDADGSLLVKNLPLILPAEKNIPYGGSYLVFQKLEQDVKLFKEKVIRLAREVHSKKFTKKHSSRIVSEMEGEWVGAQMIGRFRDGTPIALFDRPENCPTNNFDFSDDKNGRKCPFHAHIRKTNPRNSVSNLEAKRIIRRGITYGKRNFDLSDWPSTGVGLLFMSYQASIVDQFEHIIKNWCGDKDFPKQNSGVDPLIGRSASEDQPQKWNLRWNQGGSSNNVISGMEELIRFKGGEYFFAPSLSFLENIDSHSLYYKKDIDREFPPYSKSPSKKRFRLPNRRRQGFY